MDFVSLSFSSASGPEEVFLVPLLHFLELFTKLWAEGRILGWTGVALAFGGGSREEVAVTEVQGRKRSNAMG